MGPLALTVPVALQLGSEFMPPLDEGALRYMPSAMPGISISESQRLLQVTDRIIRQFPEVDRVLGPFTLFLVCLLLWVDAETGVFMLLCLDLAFEQAVRENRMTSRGDLHEAIVAGAARRIRPKFMTVATAFIELVVYPSIYERWRWWGRVKNVQTVQ